MDNYKFVKKVGRFAIFELKKGKKIEETVPGTRRRYGRFTVTDLKTKTKCGRFIVSSADRGTRSGKRSGSGSRSGSRSKSKTRKASR